MNGREMTAADENPAHSGTYTIERPKISCTAVFSAGRGVEVKPE